MAEVHVYSINDIKKGSNVLIEGVPCRVVDIATSKTGKHGHAKARIEAVGIIDGKKRVIVKPTSAKIEVPIIEKKTAQILSISGNTAQVMDSETFETFELEIPEELRGELKEGMSVIYWDVMNHKIMKQIKKE